MTRDLNSGRCRAAFAAWLVAPLILGAVQVAHAQDLAQAERLSWPPSMRLNVVSDGMQINGVDTRIYAFDSPDHADQIAEHFRREWRGRVKRVVAVPWDLLTHRDGNLLIAMQMKSDARGGTRGFISFSNVFDGAGGKPARARPDVPLLPQTHVHQLIDADDAGIRSRTVVLLSTLPPAQQLDFYRDHYRALGFEPVNRLALSRSEQGGVMVLNRGATQLNLATAVSGGQTIVAIVTVSP